MRDISFGKRYARSQFSGLIGNKPASSSVLYGIRNSRRSAFYKVKNSLSYPDLCQATDFIDKNLPENLKDLLFGNPLPKNYNELGVCDFSILSKHFIHEINWTLISIRKYFFKINLFLVYKNDYEIYLLTGQYIEAEHYLTKIENEICFSLWSLENRFLLKELENKSLENKNFLSYFNEVNDSFGFTKCLANYLSNRAERNLSVARFNADLKTALDRLDVEQKDEHRDYYLFKLSFLNNLEFEKFSEIISYDFQHSIVDRYLTLRKVLAVLLTSATTHLESAEEEQTIREYIVNRVNYMLRKIKDPILNKIKLFAGDNLFPAFNFEESQREMLIHDKFTTGLYAEVEKELSKYLLLKPQQFDLYLLYIESLVYQKKEFVPLSANSSSIQNQILQYIYILISASANPSDAAMNLLRIANNLTNVVLSYGIVDFVFFRTKGKDERTLFAKLSYNAANPNVYEVLKDNQQDYLKFLQQKFPDSITIDFLLSKSQNNSDISKFKKLIPAVKYKVELAKGLQRKKHFGEAIDLWEQIIRDHGDIIPILETAIKELFLCYEQEKRFDDCIRLYVDTFFKNAFLVTKIEVESILKEIRENRFRVVRATIDLPIFYTIINSDENELHTAFEKFNLANKVCRPSELLPQFDSFPGQKFIFYLQFTAKQEILRHSTNINGSKERLEERLSILQFLKEKNLSEKDNYDLEIKMISNILVIQKGLIDLDDGKIYVNEQGILANELKEYEAIYTRFQVISGLLDNKKSLLVLNKGKLTQLKYAGENIETQKIEYSNNPVFDIYIEMFEAVKSKFLFSKDGIVAYLSTRIRHGVLLGEIRPVFEKYRLITHKEGGTSDYRRNYHWDEVYTYESDFTKALVQDFLKEFSYNIDGLIFDLIKKHLQVFDVEINNEGWFNYDFTDDELFWFSIKSLQTANYAEFVKQIFEILWDRSDENLTKIRQKIQTTVSLQFNGLFDKLEKDLIDTLGEFSSQNIISALKACSTETQTVIQRISSWFKRSGTSASDFALENVIDIVIGYADKNKRINLTKFIECNCKIKGIYLKHFADILWIFTENILKHSDEKISPINAKIATSMENNVLRIVIENDITNKQSIESLKTVWTNEKINTSKLISEGKSGFQKAYKILKYDLMNENNTVFTRLNESEDVFSVNLYIYLTDLQP